MITSVHNPKVQALRKLQSQVRRRREEQAFVVEGVRLAEEALKADWAARQVLFTEQLDERGRRIVDGYASRRVPVEQVSPAVMEAISETETPQGLLVAVERRNLPLPAEADFLLVLDGLRDPGNLGASLRTAGAAGVQGVLLAPGCVDAWSGKVLRSGMGAHFRMPIQALEWPDIRSVVKGASTGLRVFLADASHGLPYTDADFRGPLALIVGGEAAGASAEALSLADEKVHIPMPGGSESLNAAIAASILIFEVVRQRRG